MYLIQKPGKQAKIVSPAIKAKRGRHAGSALIELMLAVVILIIVLLGTSTTYVSGRKELARQQYYQAAAQLASQKLEEAKALGYTGLTEGEQEEEIYMFGIDYHRNTLIELTDVPSSDVPKPCIKVTVTIQWTGSAGDTHQTEFVTYIGP